MGNLEARLPVDMPATDITKQQIRDRIFGLVKNGTAVHGQFPGQATVRYPRKEGLGSLALDVQTKWTGGARGDLSQPVPTDQIDLTKPVTIKFIEPKRDIKSMGIESLFQLISATEGEKESLTVNETKFPDTYYPDPDTEAPVTENRAKDLSTYLESVVVEK